MSGLVVLLFLGCAVAVAASRSGRLDPGHTDWRDSLVCALLLTGVWAAVGAEVLSQGASFTFWPILVWWGVPAVVLAGLAWNRRRDLPALFNAPLDRSTRAIVAATVFIVVLTGAIAVLTPPNTWDAVQYHLPRQAHWLQQWAVAHYPARDLRQLEMPPFQEMVSAQVLSLSGAEASANLVQWLALIGCAAAASLIARDLGAGMRIQAAAALLVMANPAAATQAVNAKNDVVVALWLCTLAYAGVRLCVQGRCTSVRVAMMGAALGLAVLTKGTAPILALPLCAVIGVWMLQQRGVGAVPIGLTIVLIAAILNLGHWERNYRSFGHPLGLPAERAKYTNEVFAPSALCSNFVRNLALHTATPISAANAAQDRALVALHESLGIQVSDSRTTFMPSIPFQVRDTYDADGNDPAPFHLLLALAGLVIGARMIPRQVPRRVAYFLLVPYLMFAVFCIVLKWQPWHARLHIPIVAVFAPVGAMALRSIPWSAARIAILVGAAALGVSGVIFNDAKPLLGPGNVWSHSWDELAFRQKREAAAATRAVAGRLADYAPAMVALADTPLEYPVIREFQRALGPGARIVDLHPRYLAPQDRAAPDAIITWGRSGTEAVRGVGEARYVAVAQSPPLTAYVRSGLVHAPAPLADFPFIGWTAREGLGDLQGPFPHWDLPIVRWGIAPRTRLEFESDGAPAVLYFECESNGMRGQAVTVTLNGGRLYRNEFLPGRGFTAHRVELRPVAGRNELVLSYELGVKEARPANRAIQFSRLQVLPAGSP